MKKSLSLIQIIMAAVTLLVFTFDASAESDKENVNGSQSQKFATTATSVEDLMPYYFAAARTGDRELMSAFIGAKLPLNSTNPKGYTALMISTYNGRYEVTKQLLQAGANACIEDKRGNTALMAAIFKAELRIAKMLMASDCDDNHQNIAGQTALMYTTLFGREQLKSLLIDRGADLALEDNSGNSVGSLEKFQQQAMTL